MTARYRPLWLILGLFLLPLAIGGGLFAYGWRPAAPAANGDLLNPARTLPELLGADGRPLDPATFTDHWTLLVASAGPCEDACRQWIVATRQVHVALYKQMSRVQRTWLTDQPAPDTAPLLAIQPDLHTAVATGAGARDGDAAFHSASFNMIAADVIFVCESMSTPAPVVQLSA